MSKALIARFMCLNKIDQDWVLENLNAADAERLRQMCKQAEALGLTRDKDFFLQAVSQLQEDISGLRSENGLPHAILALDDFWINAYLGSVSEAEVNKLASGRELPSSGKPIRVSKLLVAHLNTYIGEQKCPG